MFKVAIIGLGYFSQFHLASWREMAGCHIVGATDLDAARRDWARAEFGVDVYETRTALLAQGPDIVDIVAPPPAHANLIRAALAKGRTIICQKPFCTSAREASEIAKEAAAAGTRIVVHENFRFQPWHRTIKSVLDTDRLGDIYGARFALRPGDGRGPDAYLARQPTFQKMQRFLIHETGVHFIDLFRWFFGPVTAVYADLRQLNPVIAGEDAGLLVLDHEGGVRSQFDGNRLSDHVTDQPRRTMGELEIEGSGGTLSLTGDGRVWFRAFDAQSAEEMPLTAPVDETRFGGGCVNALNEHVVAALEGRAAFENEVDDYLPVIAVTDLAYASDAAGQKMKVMR